MRKCFVGLLVFLFPLMINRTVSAQDLSNKLNMLEIVISNLISRVESLEKRMDALEKNLSGGRMTIPREEVAAGKPPAPAVKNGFEAIGEGFFVRNIRFNSFGNNVLVTGEVTNRSEKNYNFAKFIIEIYDDRNMLLKKQEFTVPDMPAGSIRRFELMIAGIDTGIISNYIIKTH